ncbi:MAG: hypothetical protein HOY78_11285 [Saccharothrix sp.]|nr:hypothetical protein [Saccharothrix sp.]
MIPVELVQWGGLAGSGFSPVDDGGLRRAPGPFRSAAQELVHVPDGVPQPTPDLDARSALGLRVVPVPGAGSWWCFSVQVCGGRFGRTGVCQFLFAPLDGTDAWRLWEGCVAAVHAGDGLLPWALAATGLPVDPVPLGGSADTATVAQVLTGLVEGHDAVRVAGTEVAAAIAGALRVLPHAVVRDRVWTTFLAATPGNPRLRRVTGAWPEPLRGTPTAERVDRWLDGKVATPSVEDDGDDAAAVRWLAAHVREPAAVDRYRALPTIGALVASVVENELWRLGFDQVWPALHRGDDRVLRAENEPQLVSWLIGNVVQAVEWLCGPAVRLADEFADTVFGLLVWKVPEGLGLPTEDAVWFDRSAELARRRWPTVAERVKFARSLEVDDVRAMGPWFEALGLDRHDPELSDLFPVTFEAVVREVTATGDLGPLGERFLASAPADTLVRLVEAVPPLSPAVAVSWVARAGAESERRQVFRAVLARHRFAGQASAWLLAALESTVDDDVRGVVASLGAGAFGRKEQPSLELALACTEIGTRSAEPASCFAVYVDVVLAEREQWHTREAGLTEAVHRLEQDYRGLYEQYEAAVKTVRPNRKARREEPEEPVEQPTGDAGGRHAVDHGRRLLLWRNTGVVVTLVLFAAVVAVVVYGIFH